MVVRKVVFVRHGESQGNAANIYTGWGDTPLSVRGEQEACEAGLCIKATGTKFDVVYTSVLLRATKTTEIVCENSNHRSTPVVKDWHLNARHSGGLQGLTQAEAVSKYGESKVTLWRSSYDVVPACVEEDDPRHPFKDAAYAEVPRDQLPPGGESLACVVNRIVPFWRDQLVPRIQKGESILIVAHKNSLRALWKYIEQTPDDEALDAKLAPASAPLVYEFEDVGAGLVFKSKYVMNFPTVPLNLRPGSKALGSVILIRHAETVNNARGIDNGWEDTALTLKGEQQAVEAGLCLKDKEIKVDFIFTSVLQRAVKTAELVCMTSSNAFAVPVVKTWRLNARHSGALHGLTNAEAVAKYGEVASVFRTSSGAPPEKLSVEDPRHPANDPLYKDVPKEQLPSGEAFSTMAERVLPFWEEHVVPLIQAGKHILIVAHRNPLKAILEHLTDGAGKEACDSQARSTLPTALEFVADEQNSSPVLLRNYSLHSFAPQLAPTLKTVGKAVFLRHGESLCNLNEAFTGWEDSGLTPKGEKEAVEAGRYLMEEGFKFDVIFTSVLSRALESVERICKESGNDSVPVIKSWRMNARHPGVLQGMTKPEAVKAYGKEKVNLWRGSFDVMPECVSLSDPRHPVNDPLYSNVPPQDLPKGGESLAKTLDRIVPFWRDQVAPRILAGESILFVGHKNSLKALFMYLEDTSEHDMFDVRPVSATAPLVFEFGVTGFSSGLAIVKKYWVKHTEKEAIAKSRCKDGSLHM